MSKKPDNLESKSGVRIIEPYNPDMSIIMQAAEYIKLGGVVVFPSRNLYGLAADASNVRAVERVFQIKHRSADKPLSILIKSKNELNFLATEIPSIAFRLMDTFWPGKVTIVFKSRPDLPSVLTAGTGKIGIRLPEHPVAKALVNMLDHPITATSANLSGMDGVHQVSELPEDIINDVHLILDSGLLKEGKGSTVVDVTTDPITVLREGEVSQKEIYSIPFRPKN